ncbi:elongation factor P [Patescibacteria group bacterium]|nr:elongation factor P [Patescibacteria group bacterium]
MISTSDFEKGVAIIYKDEPHQIVTADFVFPGKGQAFVKTRLKNIKTGNVLENVFKSGETVEEADVSESKVVYLYNDDQGYHFMDNQNYNQQSIASDIVGKRADFLKENEEVKGLFLDDGLFDIELPFKMVYNVTEAPPGIKGDTAGTANKLVTVETGAKISVPLFIKEDDQVRVNTETGEYVERVNS